MSIITATRSTTSFFREMWQEDGKVAAIAFGILCTVVAIMALAVAAALIALLLGVCGVIPMHGGGTSPVHTPVHVIMPRMPLPVHVG